METFWVAVDELITCLIAHLHVFHPVVVFRIADTDGRTHDQSGVPFHKLCVQVGTMCMEGTDAIRSVHEAFLFCLGDNVDSSA
ncbi:unknown [Parabacteroides merdae CAG:48]|nr:unknown [Parabacteroides merdae CAG:48]